MATGDLSSLTFTPLSFPLSESAEAFTCFPDMLPVASSLTRLFAALMACFVPMIVPLPGLLVTAAVVRGADVRPEGGRLALVFLVDGAAKDFVEELKPLELLADSERALEPLTAPNDLGFTEAFTCPGLLTFPPLGEDGQEAIGALDELGIPNREMDLLDLLLLLPRLAPLFSLLSAALEPDKDRLSHLSSDI